MDDLAATDLTDEPVADPAAVDRDFAELDDDVRELVETMLTETDEALRLVVHYDGDDYEVVYAREDELDGLTEPELATRVETVVMQGLSEPERDGPLYDYGRLDATVRWYDAGVIAHVPVDEWSGLAFTFDRVDESLVELVGRFW